MIWKFTNKNIGITIRLVREDDPFAVSNIRVEHIEAQIVWCASGTV